jgi:hypothetical protein
VDAENLFQCKNKLVRYLEGFIKMSKLPFIIVLDGIKGKG